MAFQNVQTTLTYRLLGSHRPSPSHNIRAAFPSTELLNPCLSPLRVPADLSRDHTLVLARLLRCQPLPGDGSVFAPWCPHSPAQILHLLAPRASLSFSGPQEPRAPTQPLRELVSPAQNELETHKSLTSGFPESWCPRERIIDLFSPKNNFLKAGPEPWLRNLGAVSLAVTEDKETGVSSVPHSMESMTVRAPRIPCPLTPSHPIPSSVLTR